MHILQEEFPKKKDWSEEELEALYFSAFAFYQKQDYEQAEFLFKQLCLVAPLQEPFWRGFAGSLQMHSKWKESLHAWSVVALLQEEDASCHFHAAECLFSLEDYKEASKALLLAEKRASSSELSCKIQQLKALLVGTKP